MQHCCKLGVTIRAIWRKDSPRWQISPRGVVLSGRLESRLTIFGVVPMSQWFRWIAPGSLLARPRDQCRSVSIGQYSSGRSRHVEDLSASVMIQMRTSSAVL
jgi:hypothetical protein